MTEQQQQRPRFMRAQEVADRLGVHKTTAYEIIRTPLSFMHTRKTKRSTAYSKVADRP